MTKAELDQMTADDICEAIRRFMAADRPNNEKPSSYESDLLRRYLDEVYEENAE